MKAAIEVANIIKSLARKNGISVSKLLEDCGLNRNAIFTMQNSGYFPRADTLSQLADYFDCSVDYLLGRTDVPEINKSKELLEIEAIKTLEIPKTINKYNTLNTLGKQKADEYITDLSENPKYRNTKELSEIEVIRALEKDAGDGSAMIRFNTAAFGGTKNTTAELSLEDLIKLDKDYE